MMNDDSLKKVLSGLIIPEAGEGARDRALHRAAIALANAREAGEADAGARWQPLSWLFGFALCATIAAAALLLWVNVPRRGMEPSLAAAARVLGEMEMLFPGQLDAVIERNGEVDVKLAAEPVAPSQQPLIVEFIRDDRSMRVLSYSGRLICVDLGGSMTCFEALLTESGDVILAGEDFVWSAQHPSPLAGYRVHAAALHPAS